MKDELPWEEDCPSVALLREHYRQFKLHDWTTARVARLCETMRCTPRELCALVGVFGRRRVEAMWRKGKSKCWPPEVALQFAKLEAFANSIIFKTAPLPDPQDIQAALFFSRINADGGH